MNFKRGQDPIKSLGLGFGNKPKTKSWKILEFIKNQGEEGVGLKDIQYYIWTKLQGYSSEDFWKPSDDSAYNKLRATRGHWNTNLYGTGFRPGLLYKYCKKNPKTKKWVLDRMPRPGENIYTANESFKLVPESLNEILNNRYIK